MTLALNRADHFAERVKGLQDRLAAVAALDTIANRYAAQIADTLLRDAKQTDALAAQRVSMGRANHIAFVDIATHKVQTYVLVGSRAWNITESPDHKYLYIANGLSDDVSIIDLASRKNIRTIPAGRTPHSVLVDG